MLCLFKFYLFLKFYYKNNNAHILLNIFAVFYKYCDMDQKKGTFKKKIKSMGMVI